MGDWRLGEISVRARNDLMNNGLAAGEACKRVSIYPNTKRELQDSQPTSHVTHHKMYIPRSSRPNRVPVPHCPAAFHPRVTCALPLIPPKVFSYFFLYTVYRCDMERHFCWSEKQLTVHSPCTYCRKNPAWIVSAARWAEVVFHLNHIQMSLLVISRLTRRE